MAHTKEQDKTLEKELNKMETSNHYMQSSKHYSYHDAQATHWELQQHKKDLGRNKGYTK